MSARLMSRGVPTGTSAPARVTESILLLLPAGLLLVSALRHTGSANIMLWIGVGFQMVVCALTFVSRHNRRDSIAPSIIVLYVIALGWLWVGTRASDDWYPHLAQAILLVMPLLVFALQILTDSGAPAIRRAQSLAAALAH